MTAPLIDAAGTRHHPAGDDARILSVVPSLTELLFDAGLGPRVVGRTAYCVHPADAVGSIPSAGGTKKVSWRKVDAMAPTHVLLNIDENPKEMADGFAERGILPVVTHPIDVRDNLAVFGLIGGIFGVQAETDRLIRAFEQTYTEITTGPPLPERRVLYLIWDAPWMTVSAETYIARMLRLVNWTVVTPPAAARYPVIELTDALLNQTDLVLFSSEPFPFTPAHVDDFRSAHPRHAEKARLVDGELLSWYGSRAIAGLRYVRGLADREAS